MKIKYSILGSIIVIGSLLPAFSFAQNTECHKQTPGPQHGSHKYTCQNKVDKDNNKDLCGGRGSENTRPGYSCGSAYLVCHICECKEGERYNGRCVKKCTGNQVRNDNGECENCPTGTTISEDKTKCNLPPADLTDKEKCQERINAGESVQRNKTKKECEHCDSPRVCCGTKLNTNVPFIGTCIKSKGDTTKDGVATPVNVFPKLVGGLVQIVTTITLIGSFLLIVYAGVRITMAGADKDGVREGMKKIKLVAGVLALLGLSGVILKIINPTFFS